MLDFSCKTMRATVVASALLFLIGLLLQLPALALTGQSQIPTLLTSYLGFAAILLSPLLMLILFSLSLIPGINSHLQGCQH